MTEQNQDNTNILSPGEKFIEIQKQDWQIEALVVGSIIIGLIQIPSLVDRFHLTFMDLFGLRSICVETIINLPFAILLINLIIVLLVRAIWVIEAFGKKRIELMNDYNDLASSYFGTAIHVFLLYLGGAIFWTVINFLLPDNYVVFKIINIISALIFYGCIGLIGMRFFISNSFFNIKTNDKLFLFNFAVGISLLCPLYYPLYRGKFQSLSFDILQRINIKFKKKIIFLQEVDLVFYLIVAFYFFTLTSNIGFDISKEPDLKIDISDPKSPIKLDSENFESKSIGVFVHSAIIDKKGNTDELDDSKIVALFDGNQLQLDWIKYIDESGLGLKTYLNSTNFRSGFNKVTIITTRSGKKRTFDLMLHKPYD